MAKSNRPSVSVLVPVYNVAKYLRQCLDSLIHQTLRDIEIVCVNDGSTDDSAKILEEYAQKDARIVVVHKQNGGLPSARNAGLDAARGEYVGFVDADDYVDLQMFARMYARARKMKADIVVCGANCIPSPASHWIEHTLSPDKIFYKGSSVVALLYERGARPFLWRDLVRRELIERGGFRLDENIVVGEDQAFQFKIFPAARRIAFMSEKLYNYRWRRPGSIMYRLQEKDSGTRVAEHNKLVNHIADAWTKEGLFERYADHFFRWGVDFIYGDFIKASACDRVKCGRDFCDALVRRGYYLRAAELPAYIRERFSYIDSFRSKEYEAPELTVAIAADGNAAALDGCLRSVLGQSLARIEAVVYVTSGDEASMALARRWLRRDDRVCIRVAEPDWSLAERYDRIIHSAKGEFLAFFRPSDRFADSGAAARAVSALRAKESALLCGAFGRTPECSCYRQFVYRTGELRGKGIAFRDCSLWTGRMFFVRCWLSGEHLESGELIRCGGEPPAGEISEEDAKSILFAAVWLLRAGKMFGLRGLSRRITELLHGEDMSLLLSDASFRVTEKGSLSGESLFRLLVQANGLAAEDGSTDALLPALARYVRLRQDLAAAAFRR